MHLLRLYKGLSVTNRIVLTLRCGILATVVLLAIQGHPPAKAQDTDRPRVVATETMISTIDSDQNNALGKLQDFKTNQESWNAQTGKEVAEALTTARATDNKLNGGITLIGLMTAVGIGLQFPAKFKKKKDGDV